MITVTTQPGRYLITAPAGTKDSNPQLKAAVAEANELAKVFGFKVDVVKGDDTPGVGDDFQVSKEDRSPSTTRKKAEIAVTSPKPSEIEGG